MRLRAQRANHQGREGVVDKHAERPCRLNINTATLLRTRTARGHRSDLCHNASLVPFIGPLQVVARSKSSKSG